MKGGLFDVDLLCVGGQSSRKGVSANFADIVGLEQSESTVKDVTIKECEIILVLRW